MPANRQILLKSRPTGMPTPDNFELVERPVPEPGEGQVLVRLKAATLNYRDLLTVKGCLLYTSPSPRD